MTSLLLITSSLAMLNSSMVLRVINKEALPQYFEGKPNIAQKICIENCSMFYYVINSISFFTLWSAACLLGLKYKMTAHKIHIAVSEHSLVDHARYRQILNQFTGIFALCLMYFALMMTIIPGILMGGWPEYLFKIASGVAFCLIMILFVAFLLSFKEMKDALQKHTANVSMRV
jgi:hypothetical protein